MRTVEVVSGAEPLRQSIAVGPHTLVADEPVADGGNDAGPQPHELLLAALGSCTAMTLRLYAARKKWPLSAVHVRLDGARRGDAFVIRRRIVVDGGLSADERERLHAIADKCPVHKTLSGTIAIETSLRGSDQRVQEADEESFPASDPPAWTLGDDGDE